MTLFITCTSSYNKKYYYYYGVPGGQAGLSWKAQCEAILTAYQTVVLHHLHSKVHNNTNSNDIGRGKFLSGFVLIVYFPPPSRWTTEKKSARYDLALNYDKKVMCSSVL